MMELYRSECCGTVVTPGSTEHDNIVEAEQGTRLVLERKARQPGGLDTLDLPTTQSPPKSAGGETWERVHRISDDEAELYDAMRAGECPTCGREAHGLTLLEEVDA